MPYGWSDSGASILLSLTLCRPSESLTQTVSPSLTRVTLPVISFPNAAHASTHAASTTIAL